MGCTELCGGVHTAHIQRQIPFGLCTHFIGISLCHCEHNLTFRVHLHRVKGNAKAIFFFDLSYCCCRCSMNTHIGKNMHSSRMCNGKECTPPSGQTPPRQIHPLQHTPGQTPFSIPYPLYHTALYFTPLYPTPPPPPFTE